MATIAPPETSMHNAGKSASSSHVHAESSAFCFAQPSIIAVAGPHAAAATAPHAAATNVRLVICFATVASVSPEFPLSSSLPSLSHTYGSRVEKRSGNACDRQEAKTGVNRHKEELSHPWQPQISTVTINKMSDEKHAIFSQEIYGRNEKSLEPDDVSHSTRRIPPAPCTLHIKLSCRNHEPDFPVLP